MGAGPWQGSRAPQPSPSASPWRSGGTLGFLARVIRWPILAALLLAAPAWAQPVPRDALPSARRAAEAAREEAARRATEREAAAAEERRLAERRVAGAARVQGAEREAATASARIAEAEAQGAAARAEAERLSAALAPMLPLLLRVSRHPAESLLAAPAPPEETLRGLLVMQALLREAGEVASSLRAAEARAAEEARRLQAERQRLAAAEAEGRAAVAALDRELEEARARRSAVTEAEAAAARRAQDAAARARTLEEAIARLEREEAARSRQDAARAAQQAAARTPEPERMATGGRPLPVAGQVARGFGAPGDGGPAQGLTLAAGAHARVVSPCGGRVAFAGPFRSYGRLVIVDCGGGEHVVLAGLERLDAQGGQRVLPGEPVGVLPGAAAARLYMEVRRGGVPVDPRPWLGLRG